MGLPQGFSFHGVIKMKKLGSVILLFATMSALPFLIKVVAQSPVTLWSFFVDVTPRNGAPGTYDLVVPLQVMDKSREDLADLRLYDAKGKEIPFALRIRKEVDDKREIATRLFNQASVGSTARDVSVDLGENAGEHNEIEIETAGTNFRRRVDLEGSDSGKEWRTLMTGEVVFSFESQNKVVESSRVSYPTSRYRYLRVRVLADELTDKQAPQIGEVKVLMAVREKGDQTTWNVDVARFDSVRNQGAPASAWTIDLGFRVPCDRLTIEIGDESFSRPFQVEAVDDPQNVRLIASGELTRRIGEASRPLVIYFVKEEQVRKLRLLMNDFSNQTLSITSIQPGAPARQLVFELKEPAAQPLRLFFGNLKATAPHYDFEKELSAKLATAPIRSEVGAVAQNPDYKAEPLPLTERVPWLIYVVLAVSSLALAMILFSLARTSFRTGQQSEESEVGTSSG
jgi:hypothetical protein